jgi:lysozyme
MMRPLLLLDLYEGDTINDWGAVVNHSDGAWLKASEGLTFNDHLYPARQRLAEHRHYRHGAYPYAHPESHSPLAEAQHFAAVVDSAGGIGRRDLNVALDLEAPNALQHLSGHELGQWARDWNHEVRRRLKLAVFPLLYSYPAYIAYINPSTPIGGGLWLASFARNDGTDHGTSVPHPWRHYAAHQFSSRCSLTGCSGHVDLSHAPRLRPLLANPLRGLA